MIKNGEPCQNWFVLNLLLNMMSSGETSPIKNNYQYVSSWIGFAAIPAVIPSRSLWLTNQYRLFFKLICILGWEDSEVMEKIADQCAFKNTQKNDMSDNYAKVPDGLSDQSESEFLRKGKIWYLSPFIIRNLLTVAKAEYFDSHYEDKMSGMGTNLHGNK